MKNIKALFFDIDGTLYSSKNRRVEPSTIEILKRLSEDELIHIYISSGRSFQTLGEIKNIVPYFDGLNLANGGEIVIHNKNYSSYFEVAEAKNLLDYLNKHHISYGVISNEKQYRRYFNEEIKNIFDQSVKCDYELINDDYSKFIDKVIQIWILDVNEKLDEIKSAIPKLNYFYWSNFGADVVPLNRTKANGIEKICKIMGYDYNNTYAFGDADNDVPMFKVVKTSVSMGRCSKACYDNASYHTDLIEEDGLKNAILKYVYNEL